MPVAPQVTYPGVYIQEVPSDVHTIVPVPTATTAFIGRALRGPVNEPILIHNFGDFQRIFDGLWTESQLGYAVSDFYLNGGSDAVIVRLYRPGPEMVQAASEVAGVVEERKDDLVNSNKKKEAIKALEEASAKYEGADEKNAATAVVKAVKNALKAQGVTAAAVVTAARRAVPNPKTSLPLQTLYLAALKVFKAVDDEASKTVKPPETATEEQKEKARADAVKELKDAATAARDALKPPPEKDSADETAVNAVVDAVKREAERPGEPKPTVETVVDAAWKALIPNKSGTPVTLEAAHEGAWGNSLRVRVTDVDRIVLENVAKRYDVPEKELFNLDVRDLKTNATESFLNVTVVPGPRQLDKVLENESQLIRVAGLLDKDAKRPNAHPAARKGKNWWEDPMACNAPDDDGRATDGEPLTNTEFEGNENAKTGIYALKNADIFNLLVIPPYNGTESGDVDTDVLAKALAFCKEQRAVLLVDPPSTWTDKDKAKAGFPIPELSPDPNAAVYFPRIRKANPLHENRIEEFAPGGSIAGVIARTDAARGVWKAPAGLEATLSGVAALTVPLTDPENGELNPLGINCLRQLPAAGYVVWGARTLEGDDRLASQWKYLPVRRTALFIEESLYRGTQWAVFEPNDEPLWSQLRLNIGVFMHGLFIQGAFQGQSPQDAYFVRCDGTTTTQADIDRGIVNVIVGFAPLKPAEFVVLYIQQIAGQLAV